jgi:hypothetical protein
MTESNMDGRAFATPKGLRPRRRVKPGHDGSASDYAAAFGKL